MEGMERSRSALENKISSCSNLAQLDHACKLQHVQLPDDLWFAAAQNCWQKQMSAGNEKLQGMQVKLTK